jgi:glutamate synthase (NADPH/NADH) small chain
MPKKTIIPQRTEMQEQPPEVRIHNFNEVTCGYTPEQAMMEARRCLQCAKPGCLEGCPVNVDIPGFLKRMEQGDFRGAIQIIKENNSLPAITGRVCSQETHCEGACLLSKKFQSVSIGRLERFAADWEAKEGELAGSQKNQHASKKVAVVGSGPSSLTVAADLALLGYQVKIFEALHEPGGVLTYGIPEFRLPKEIVKREVDYIRSLGVEIDYDFIVGYTATVDELLETFDAVFLGTGAGLPWFLGIPGENLSGVYSSNEYLTRSNLMKAYRFPDYDTPIAVGRRVITIGGGNTAMDAARTALRLGAKESIIVYRRSRAEMPARVEEVHHAEQEGVKFYMLTSPLAFYGEGGRLAGLECLRNELGEPDASGRRKPVPVEGSNFRIDADVAICAIGQSPSPVIAKTTPDLQTGRDGIIVVNQNSMKTSKKGVLAGGDVITGGATVILAMGQAKIAARAIHDYFQTGNW